MVTVAIMAVDYTLPFLEKTSSGGGSENLRGFEQNRSGPRGIIRRPTIISGPPDANGKPDTDRTGPRERPN